MTTKTRHLVPNMILLEEGVYDMMEQLNKSERAVSPVIGVMLMLVVTVILAAAVSSYAGSIQSNAQKAPQLVMDIKIKNTGHGNSSYIGMDVISVSEPIPTKDLKIMTSYVNSTGARKGSSITAWDGNVNNTQVGTNSYHSPLGFGKGVNGEQKTSGNYSGPQYFGKYTLIPGTSMKNSPTGLAQYTYNHPDIDGVRAILGKDWNELREGDIVNVKIVHIPSGQALVDVDVGVQG